MYNYLRSQLANFLTYINMVLGLFAILYAAQGKYHLSCLLIVIAALTDRFDGIVARKLNITSAIGKYLDSNSDLISFGIAPAFLIYFSIFQQQPFEIWGVIVVFFFAICGAFRLARYNAITFDGFYVGVPITIAGAVLAVTFLAKDYIPAIAYIPITIVLGYVMISTFSIKKR